MPIVGNTSAIVPTPTLAGAAGSFEGEPAVVLTPPESGTVPGLSVTWALEGTANGSVTVDNLQGDAVGALTGSIDVVVEPAPAVVLADALAVEVVD
jgi:hypothetical protein